MKELVVISGKGGTGKTSLVSSFAYLAKDKVLCDADVDAADLHLILNPSVIERHDFYSGHTAVIDHEKCIQCGLCREYCKWNAISENFVVDTIECEGCGVCNYFCPVEAVEFPVNNCGDWYISDTRFGPMVHASLGIAEENSGKLVALVRKEGRKVAEDKGIELLITDGAPGVGCPVIASLGGADAVLIVTEPTVSGAHDMERVVNLAEFFKVPIMVCVNKSDLNPQKTAEIQSFSKERGLNFLGSIPFDPVFTKAMVQGENIFEYSDNSEAAEAVREVWRRSMEALGYG